MPVRFLQVGKHFLITGKNASAREFLEPHSTVWTLYGEHQDHQIYQNKGATVRIRIERKNDPRYTVRKHNGDDIRTEESPNKKGRKDKAG